MAYIGNPPISGNFQVCDAISVVNGQASYTMQVSSANVSPESANHMLVSLNGVLQKPNSSFTISGSTITFASNLATGDVIDFILLLGNVNDIGTPSDATVTNAKTNFTTTSSAAGLQIKGDGTTAGALQLNCEQNSHGIKLQSPAHSSSQSYTLKFPTGNVTADKFLKVASVSGSGTTGIGQLSFDDAGGGMWTFISETTASDSSSVDFTTLSTDFKDFCFSLQNLHPQNDNVRVYMKVYTGTGGSQALVTAANYGFVIESRDNAEETSNDGGEDHWRINDLTGNDTNENSSAEVILYNPQSSLHKLMRANGVRMGTDSGRVASEHSAGVFKSTDLITGVRFLFSGGNIQTGKIAMYGRKRS